jgi:hypothetical protein
VNSISQCTEKEKEELTNLVPSQNFVSKMWVPKKNVEHKKSVLTQSENSQLTCDYSDMEMETERGCEDQWSEEKVENVETISLSSLLPGGYKAPLMRLVVKIEGHEVEALVDTGSAITLLHYQFLKQHGLERCLETLEQPCYLKGIGTTDSGSSLKVNQCVELLVQAVPNSQQHWKFLVVEFPMETQVLLGMDWLVSNKVKLDLHKMQMSVADYPKKVQLSQWVGEIPTYVTEVYPLKNLDEEELTDWISSLSKTAELNEEQKGQLWSLLEEYRDVFKVRGQEFGQATVSPFEIRTVDDIPVKQASRRLAPNLRTKVQRQVQEMLDLGVIRPTSSPWASPILLVRKKDGTWRFCIDYRQLNAKTISDAHPLMDQRDIRDSLIHCPYRSKLDAVSGYWQIPMTKAASEKAAFVTPWGQYTPTCMPFGLTNAPPAFQRYMTQILGHAFGTYAWVYIDDVLVYSRTFEEHKEHLKQVFERFKEHHIYLKISKCSFVPKEMEYLGHILVGDGIGVDQKKVKVVKEVPTPKNRTEVRGFLGLTGYYRKYIPRYAELARPLTRLTSEKEVFRWQEQEQEAFEKLKQTLCDAPVLKMPDFGKPFFLYTDASNFAVGAVLEQEDIEGNKRVIAYNSYALRKGERNWGIIEKEAFAIVHFLQKFRYYLVGSKVTVISDHSALQWLFHQKEPTGRVARWIMKIQEFSPLTVMYRAGRTHSNGDAMSRQPFVFPVNFIEWSGPNKQELLKDPEWKEVLRYRESSVLDGNTPEKDRKVVALAEQIVEEQGQVYRAWWPQRERGGDHSRLQWVVPKSQREEVMKVYYDLPVGGHAGHHRMYLRMLNKYWWPGMWKDTKEYCHVCDVCQAVPHVTPTTKGPLQSIRASRPWELITMDLITNLPYTKRKNKNLLVVVDHFSKWPEVVPIPNKQARTVAKALVQVFSRWGVPSIILSDNGLEFKGDLNGQLIELLGVTRKWTTPYHPQGNGLVERMNRTIKEMLKKFSGSHPTDWDELIPQLMWGYRMTPHESTGVTPFEVMTGRDPDGVDQIVGADVQNPQGYLIELKKALKYTQEEVLKRSEKARYKQSKAYDHTLAKESVTQGDWVMLKRPVAIDSGKITPDWEGPYKVKDRKGLVIALEKKAGTGEVKRVNQERVKPYRGEVPSKDNVPKGHYEIEKIVDHRGQGKKIEYKVRWKGWTSRNDSWIKRKDLNADRLLNEYRRTIAEDDDT